MNSAESCETCGTFAIGRCMECGRLVCGDCSTRFQSKRLCTTHAQAAVAEVREREAAEQRRAARELAERLEREGALDNTPLDMTAVEAFDIAFVSGGAGMSRRQLISARRVLRELDTEAFVRLALSRFRARAVPTERFNVTGGSTPA